MQVLFATNPVAPWSIRVAGIAVQLILVGIVLHRFASLSTPVALNLFVAAFAAAALALLLAVFALSRIWNRGEMGAGRAIVAMLLSLGVFAWPMAYVPTLLALPEINDITTDTRQPPRYVALAAERRGSANPPYYPGPVFADQQISAYPDLVPLRIARPIGEVFDVTRSTVENAGLTIVAANPPGDGDSPAPGVIEAIAYSLILGFPDDVSIRIVSEGETTRIDLRSSSRYGRHDFGANARRVRLLSRELKGAMTLPAPPTETKVVEKEKVGGSVNKPTRSRSTSRSRSTRSRQSTPRRKRSTSGARRNPFQSNR